MLLRAKSKMDLNKARFCLITSDTLPSNNKVFKIKLYSASLLISEINHLSPFAKVNKQIITIALRLR